MTAELEKADLATRDLLDAAERGMDDLARSDIDMPDEKGDYRFPWDQQAEESDLFYTLYLQYRDQGRSRTILDGWKWYRENELGTAAKNSYYVYAKTWDWRERARLWDQYEEAQYQLARGQARREMAERHEVDIVNAIKAVVVPFEALTEAMRTDEFIESLATMKPARLIDITNRAARALPSLMSAERLARGEATEIVVGQIDVQHNLVIERDQIAEILGVLEAAGAFVDGSAVDESLEIIDAEVVDVHPVPPDDHDDEGRAGDLDEATDIPDSSGA